MAEKMANININLDTKKKFTINNDKNKIIELDVSDINIVQRLRNSIDKMNALEDNWNNLIKTDGTNDLNTVKDFAEGFAETERKMRDIIDYIFNSKVADVILGNTSAFAPIDGRFKFDIIIDTLSKLYEKQITTEVTSINKQHIEKHVNKYINGGLS